MSDNENNSPQADQTQHSDSGASANGDGGGSNAGNNNGDQDSAPGPRVTNTRTRGNRVWDNRPRYRGSEPGSGDSTGSDSAGQRDSSSSRDGASRRSRGRGGRGRRSGSGRSNGDRSASGARPAGGHISGYTGDGKGGFIAKSLFVCAAAVILLAGISEISNIISIVLLALLISVAALPLLKFLEQRKWPIWLILITIFILMLLIVFFVTMFIPSAVKAVYESAQTFSEMATEWVKIAELRLVEWGLFEPGFSLRALIDFDKILGFSGSVLNIGVGVLSDFFLVITLVMFMLFEAHSAPQRASGLFDQHPRFKQAATSFLWQLRHYLLIKLGTSALTACLLLPVLWIFLPTNPWPWAFLALIMNFVPIFGSVVAAIPPVLMMLVEGDIVGTSVVAGAYIAVNICVGNILEPRIMGRGLGLSALVVLISLSFWGWILGLVGLFMAVPLTLSIKLLLETDDQLRWIAMLLSEPKDIKDDS